jgi:hypothetical protein
MLAVLALCTYYIFPPQLARRAAAPRHYRASQAEHGRASLDHPSYCATDIQTNLLPLSTLRAPVLASHHLRHPLAVFHLETLPDKALRLRLR